MHRVLNVSSCSVADAHARSKEYSVKIEVAI